VPDFATVRGVPQLNPMIVDEDFVRLKRRRDAVR
jgi:hypothetical protein